MVRNRPAVPVSMGSIGFQRLDTYGVRVTHARFPAAASIELHAHDRPTLGVVLEGGFDLFFSSGRHRRQFECVDGCVYGEPTGFQHADNIYQVGARVLTVQPDVGALDLPPAIERMLGDVNYFRHAGITTIARRLARELNEGDDLAQLAVEALATEMLVEGTRVAQARPYGATPRWLCLAEGFIEANFTRSIKLRDIATAAGVTTTELATVFKRRHRVPVGTYVRRRRLEWVADQLLSSDESISRLAARAGFADQAHLTRAFKATFGRPPARYRRALGNGTWH